MARREVMAEGIVSIYALCEYPGDVPRYVGKTNGYICDRHKEHIYTAKKPSHLPVRRWLRKQIETGAVLTIKHLEFVPPGGPWAERESYWINRLRSEGFNLLNLTDGGEGLPGHVFSDAHRAAISAALRTCFTRGCTVCGAPMTVRPSHDAKGDDKFCSRECYGAWQRGKPRVLPEGMSEKGVAAAAERRRAQTHCKRGHLLSGPNLYRNPRGARVCRECTRLHKQAYLRRRNVEG